MMTFSEMKQQLIDLVEHHWTQGTYARDVADKPVPPLSPEACKWCDIQSMWRRAHRR